MYFAVITFDDVIHVYGIILHSSSFGSIRDTTVSLKGGNGVFRPDQGGGGRGGDAFGVYVHMT